ncbi:hypothetical protein M0813_23362 [Anaeramoeba flamelloides]|uniref:Transmembrane protein n=1 Tax=Anaeramoeba flamelloides TaxID=1746091 RepID=A0ABQ8Y8U0_9EUKA|nr:hypothetical protein M0813_23362 [Anaeramoeba flamelloides]
MKGLFLPKTKQKQKKKPFEINFQKAISPRTLKYTSIGVISLAGSYCIYKKYSNIQKQKQEQMLMNKMENSVPKEKIDSVNSLLKLIQQRSKLILTYKQITKELFPILIQSLIASNLELGGCASKLLCKLISDSLVSLKYFFVQV